MIDSFLIQAEDSFLCDRNYVSTFWKSSDCLISFKKLKEHILLLNLDGDIIEKVGVEPDLNIPFENSGEFKDSQLNYAIDYLSKK